MSDPKILSLLSGYRARYRVAEREFERMRERGDPEDRLKAYAATRDSIAAAIIYMEPIGMREAL